ncbi:MAG: hypothetical protein VX035_10840, partial [Planctomycetota bacterium]|nr:hypothetical protein [Planctomycetota bacterium]
LPTVSIDPDTLSTFANDPSISLLSEDVKASSGPCFTSSTRRLNSNCSDGEYGYGGEMKIRPGFVELLSRER